MAAKVGQIKTWKTPLSTHWTYLKVYNGLSFPSLYPRLAV